MRLSVAAALALGIASVATAVGCTHNPFRTAASSGPISLTPPPGVAAPANTLPQPVTSLMPSFSQSNLDSGQLEANLVRSRQETQLMQDEITALRDQLASTSSQLAQNRTANMPSSSTAGRGPIAGGKGVPPTQPLGMQSPAAMQAAMAQLSIPGVESRLDGAVVRVEIQSERLFEASGASLLPGGAAILTQISTELERVYPGHFVGIEGHTDTEPLQNASWGSPHQLSAARASAVFDFLTARTTLEQGQLFLVAHGANHPLVSNATAAGRSRNRRIELVIYPERSGGPR
ncbi:MAG: OmpA family protein [Planctomycetota bacterium]|nr:OmpA family protein [Planctomycetia bacterium]